MPVAASKEEVKAKLLAALQSHAESADGDLQKYLASKYASMEQKNALRQQMIDFFTMVPGANGPEKLGKWLQASGLPVAPCGDKRVDCALARVDV